MFIERWSLYTKVKLKSFWDPTKCYLLPLYPPPPLPFIKVVHCYWGGGYYIIPSYHDYPYRENITNVWRNALWQQCLWVQWNVLPDPTNPESETWLNIPNVHPKPSLVSPSDLAVLHNPLFMYVCIYVGGWVRQQSRFQIQVQVVLYRFRLISPTLHNCVTHTS